MVDIAAGKRSGRRSSSRRRRVLEGKNKKKEWIRRNSR